jgi:hypothetical protein
LGEPESGRFRGSSYGLFPFWLLIIRGVETIVVSLPLCRMRCVSLVLVQALPTSLIVNWAALSRMVSTLTASYF